MDFIIITFVFETIAFIISVMATNVIIHEFGHAIPALVITKAKTEIFIGSYGDKTSSVKLNIGLLEMWFKINPLRWRNGLCRHSATGVSIKKQFIITAGGPVASLVVALISILVFSSLKEHQQIRVMMLPFFYYGFLFFLLTVIPIDKKIILKNGNVLFNDGYKLRSMARVKKYHKKELEAIQCYTNGDYKTAGQIFEFLLNKKIAYKTIFLNAIYAYIAQTDAESVSRVYRDFSDNFNLTADDYCNIGGYRVLNKMEKEALTDFEKAFALNPKHVNAMCNLGYYHILDNDFNKALAYFDDALAINPAFAYAFSNRGLAKIKLGSVTEGLNDIHSAIALDSKNAYAYRSLGIYHKDIGNYPEALSHFNKAKELDANTHLIQELIMETENCVADKTSNSTIP